MATQTNFIKTAKENGAHFFYDKTNGRCLEITSLNLKALEIFGQTL